MIICNLFCIINVLFGKYIFLHTLLLIITFFLASSGICIISSIMHGLLTLLQMHHKCRSIDLDISFLFVLFLFSVLLRVVIAGCYIGYVLHLYLRGVCRLCLRIRLLFWSQSSSFYEQVLLDCCWQTAINFELGRSYFILKLPFLSNIS